ncbi:MAG: iron transporter [Negativicutes bacterium]|nr:iron transporter [Negativicutes bacterium]
MVLALFVTGAQGFAAEQKGFQEYPIGDEQEFEGIKIEVVYFQPVPMEPTGMGLTPEQSDIHLETDIHATEDNKTGFGVGDWVPYLSVHYKLTKLDSGQVIEGNLMPMNANDGPHYGANVKMLGAGKYQMVFTIESPDRQGFMLHVDKETGVEGRFWTAPIVAQWEFDYIPRSW